MPTTVVEENEKVETEKDKKDELLLDSLEIKGYRCFEHLTIEKLGRVNLIVGKNNVGKTALLEALSIWSNRFKEKNIVEILNYLLEKRDERNAEMETDSSVNKIFKADAYGNSYRHLFFNRPKEKSSSFHITKKHIEPPSMFPLSRVDINVEYNDITDRLEIKNDNKENNFFYQEIDTLFIESEGIQNTLMTQIWDDIILENRDDDVLVALKHLSDRIIDLNFINYPKDSKNRVPVVKVDGINERVPLNSFGEGMNRLLGISLSLLSSKDGILLIDEIESGLHYSVLPDVWKLIFKTAKELNVQVFATTHSKDCIEAFAIASNESPEDGMLVRLERHGEKIVAKTINEDRLAQAVNHDVEVR